MNTQKNFSKKQIAALVLLSSIAVSFLTGTFMVTVAKNADSPLNNFLSKVIQKSIGEDKLKGKLGGIWAEQENTVVNIIEKINPAVVSIIATKDVPIIEQYYINPFGDNNLKGLIPPGLFDDFQVPQYRQKGIQEKQISSGTGFFVSSNGLILTNKHVVSDETAKYTIIMNNGKRVEGKVIARDKFQDIAILEVQGNNYPFIPLGDSDEIKVGQTAIAIGNALGEFQNTVSVGVISGLRRTIVASGGAGESEKLQSLIQTDAAINPGNSGGPLLDLTGRVIGINTAIASNAQNIGFALPINFAKKDIEDVKKFSRIKTPFLGIRYIIITPDIQEKYKLKSSYGALISKGPNGETAILEKSPAYKLGIREGDIILEFDNKKIDTSNTLADMIAKKSVGEMIPLKVFKNGKETKLFLLLEEIPANL